MDAKKLISYIRAGFPAFWLQTHEVGRVKDTIYNEVRDFELKDGSHYNVMEWNCLAEPDPSKPLAMLSDADECSVMFLHNFHWFIDKPPVIQLIQDAMPVWASSRKHIVVVSCKNSIPAELEKDFVQLDLALPKEKEIIDAINHVAPEGFKLPTGKDMQRLIDVAKGFTGSELENVLSLCLVEKQDFDIATINEHKATTIKRSGFLDVLKANVTFKDIIGYEDFKAFVMDSIDKPSSKGVIAIGPPGCGKTSIMRAICAESGKFGVSVNMGKLQSKWRGETDQNVDATIKLIEALGDCFVLIDEFEKQFAGAGGSGETDEGTTKRTTGRWLDFLQDRPEGIYITATCNSIQGIPGEYLRIGRWDSSPFFIDLPSKKVRLQILKHYVEKAGMNMPATNKVPTMEHYSGAEIEGLVHIANLRGMSLMQADESIFPLAVTMKENIDAIRSWAKDRCTPAEKIPGVKVGAKRRIDA